MQYTVSIDIDLPRREVMELFDDVENLYKWQRGLQSFEHLEGEPGQPGAISKLVFQMGKRRVEMHETITAMNPPEMMSATYEAKGVHNVIVNRFEDIGPEKTRWVSECEFQFSGMMKLIGFLFKGMFPKQSLQYMQDFKNFAEQGTDVREG